MDAKVTINEIAIRKALSAKPKLTANEIGAKGGKSRSDRKMAASSRNIAKARETLAAKRQAGLSTPWSVTKPKSLAP